MTRSKFLRVKCDCSNEQVIFGNSKSVVKCVVDGTTLAEPAGDKAQVFAKILKIL